MCYIGPAQELIFPMQDNSHTHLLTIATAISHCPHPEGGYYWYWYYTCMYRYVHVRSLCGLPSFLSYLYVSQYAVFPCTVFPRIEAVKEIEVRACIQGNTVHILMWIHLHKHIYVCIHITTEGSTYVKHLLGVLGDYPAIQMFVSHISLRFICTTAI